MPQERGEHHLRDQNDLSAPLGDVGKFFDLRFDPRDLVGGVVLGHQAQVTLLRRRIQPQERRSDLAGAPRDLVRGRLLGDAKQETDQEIAR